MKKIFIGIAMSCLLMNAKAQNQEDIFRYSFTNTPVSARTLGLSGAWGAVGADLSAASLNPAGLGLYRRSEMMGSMAITTNFSNAEYRGNTMSDTRTGFNIPNLGIVFNWLDQYKGKDKRVGLVSASISTGINRINDFQSNMQYSGNNSNTTIGDYLAILANGRDSGNFWSEDYDNDLPAMAWRTVLIDNADSPSFYRSRLAIAGDSSYDVKQSQVIQTRGRMNEWYFGGGINLSNVVYLGATLVIKDVRYTSENTYFETLLRSSTNNTYKSSSITQSLRTVGSGVGGKFGIIVRPADFVRLGVSYHTPVRLNLTDYYQNSLTMNYSSGKSYTEPATGREDYYKYQIVTPASLNLSAAVTIGKVAVVAFDYERINYANGRLQAIDQYADFSYANGNNKAIYGNVSNYRGGIELRMDDFRLRGGYALLGSPFNDSKVDGSKQVISGGIGYIFNEQFFFDFAVSDRIGKEYVNPYETNNATAVNTSNKLNFMFGAGYRF